MAATVGHLQRLAWHGVAFRSFTEEHLSTENEPEISSWRPSPRCQSSSAKRSVSVRKPAWSERAPKARLLGRPRFADGDRDTLIAETGDSWHAVEHEDGIPYSTVKKRAGAPGY